MIEYSFIDTKCGHGCYKRTATRLNKSWIYDLWGEYPR